MCVLVGGGVPDPKALDPDVRLCSGNPALFKGRGSCSVTGLLLGGGDGTCLGAGSCLGAGCAPRWGCVQWGGAMIGGGCAPGGAMLSGWVELCSGKRLTQVACESVRHLHQVPRGTSKQQ